MPNLSDKAYSMPASPIHKLVPYSEAAKAAGKVVHHLNIGQPDISTPKEAIDAIKNLHYNVIEYSNSEGFTSYRAGLRDYYNKLGIDIAIGDVMVTTGGSEALLFAFQACFNPGDELIVPEPFYANYNGFAVSANMKVVPVMSTIETGFKLPPVEDFEKLITPKTKGILICNPGNPTGYLYSRAELERLAEIVRKHDLWLIADEVYREFCYDNKEHYSVMNLPGLEQNVILIDSTSKRYSMCGARIGALICRNNELMKNALKFAQARLSPPTFGQIAGEAALTTPQSYFDEVTDEYVHRRDALVEGLNAIPGVVCPMPSGAFYCIAELPVEDAEEFCQWMLESFDYEGETVMMAPAAGFYATPGAGKKQVRIAYVLKIASLKRAVKCLEEALKIYPHRTEIKDSLRAKV